MSPDESFRDMASTVSDEIVRIALDKKVDEPLTQEQKMICEQWIFGRGAAIMQAETFDTAFFHHLTGWLKKKYAKMKHWQNRFALQLN